MTPHPPHVEGTDTCSVSLRTSSCAGPWGKLGFAPFSSSPAPPPHRHLQWLELMCRRCGRGSSTRWSPTVTRGPRPVPHWSLPGSWGRGRPGAGWQDGRPGSERRWGQQGRAAAWVLLLPVLWAGAWSCWGQRRRASCCWRSPDFLGLTGVRGPSPPGGKERMDRGSPGHTCSASHNLCSGTFEE